MDEFSNLHRKSIFGFISCCNSRTDVFRDNKTNPDKRLLVRLRCRLWQGNGTILNFDADFFSAYQFLLFQSFKLISFILGGIILIWIGLQTFNLRQEDFDTGLKNKSSRRNSIYAGFAISITNPFNIITFISVSTYLAQYSSKIATLINIILFVLGGLIFNSGLAGLVQITNHKFGAGYMLLFSKIFGFVLIGYGTYFWYQFINLFGRNLIY